MVRRLLILLGIYVGVGFVVTATQSCHGPKVNVCDIELRGYTKQSHQLAPDTLRNGIKFFIRGIPKETCYIPWYSTVISSCYAFKKCVRWQNELLQSSFRLTLDTKIVISQDTILPNTDLFQVPAFKDGISIEEDDFDCTFFKYTIEWGSELISRTTFEPGVYNVTFSSKTTDNKTLTTDRRMVFIK